MAEISVGIDLGTTNSCISTCWPNGQPRLLRDDTGVGVIPSVVSFLEDGRLEVGTKARQRLLTDLGNTFYSVKRFIGRDMRLEENRWAASQYPFSIEAGQNGIPMAVTRGRRFPVYQISGHVLEYLKGMAEKSLDQSVTKAVITVPANFNEVQRRSTHQAGEYAGFEVLRVFNEPTAAALAYGLGKDTRRIIAVYDFGGGTFDITILRLEDPVFEVLSTSGDMLLGGDDFDRKVLADMFEQFRRTYGFDPGSDQSLVQRFTLGAERMKCQLTDWIVTAFEDRHVRNPSGSSLPPFHYEINRDRFRALVNELAERSFVSCDEAFKLAGLGTGDIDEVILVGGTTRIPFLRQRVREYFGRPPLDKIQPDVVVSIGAAIQAYALAGGDLIYPARTRDMLPIRKVEPRPPAAKPRESADMEILDDLSDDLMLEEEASMRKLAGGRTMKGMAATARPADRPESGERAPSPPSSTHLQARPSAAPGAARKKTMPLTGTPSRPPSGPRDSEPPDRRRGQTLRYAPAIKPPSSAGVVDLPGNKPGDGPSAGGFSLADPFAGEDLPLRKVTGGHEYRPRLDPVEPALLEPEPPEEPGPDDLEVVMPTPAAPPGPVASPRPASSFSSVGQPAQAHEAMGMDLFDDSDVAIAPLDILESRPSKAPMVTPEAAAQPYVPQDVIEEMERQPAVSSPGADPIAAMMSQPARAPLLLDVTPHTLCVATVGGFVEVIVRKNSPVPIEKAHLFTTSVDDQERAVIKVLEGESPRAADNHVLGEVELVGMRKAPRGAIKIEVMCEITVDGILKVSGRNLETGEAQVARLTLFGG